MTLREVLLNQGYTVAVCPTNGLDASDVPLMDLDIPEDTGVVEISVESIGFQGARELYIPTAEESVLAMTMPMYRQWCNDLYCDPESMYQAMERAIAAPTVKERLLAAGSRVRCSRSAEGGGEDLPLAGIEIPEGTEVLPGPMEYHCGQFLLTPGRDQLDAPVALTLAQYRSYCDTTNAPEKYQRMAEQLGA
jgi:hypothetical protein